MTHEFRISFYDPKDKKFKIVLQTFNKQDAVSNASVDGGEKFIPVNYKPYIAVTLSITSTLITGATLSWGNPPESVAKNMFGRIVKIECMYASLKDNKFQLSQASEFIGVVTQPPYYVDGTTYSDKILVMPLSMGAVFDNKPAKLPDTMKIGDVLNAIFNIEGVPKTINYYPKTIKDQYLKKEILFNPNTMNLTQLIDYFLEVEDLIIKIMPNCCISVSNREYIKRTLKNKSTELNTGIIHNEKESVKSQIKKGGGFTRGNYVMSFLKTRFAVMNLSGGVDIELAFFLPHLIGKEYCIIKNVGTNINIYASVANSTTTKTQTGDMTFYIQRQEVVFSTWGDSSHTLGLQNIDYFNRLDQQEKETANETN